MAVKAITAPTKRSSLNDKPSRLKIVDVTAKIESSTQQQEPSSTPAVADKSKDEDKKPAVPIRKTSRLQTESELLADEIPDPPPQLRISATMDEKLRNGELFLRLKHKSIPKMWQFLGGEPIAF